MLEWAINQVSEASSLISGAPVPFGFSILAIGIILWSVINWYYKGQIDNKNSEISALKTQLERCRDFNTLAVGAEKSSDHDNNLRKRNYIIGKLVGKYLIENPDAPQRLHHGLDPIPPEWINKHLAELDEEWRVRIGRDGDYEIIER